MGFGRRTATGSVEEFQKPGAISALQKEFRAQIEGRDSETPNLTTKELEKESRRSLVGGKQIERSQRGKAFAQAEENIIKRRELDLESQFLKRRQREIRGLTSRPGRRATILTQR